MSENEKLSVEDLKKTAGGDRDKGGIVIIGPDPQPQPPFKPTFQEIICPKCGGSHVEIARITLEGLFLYCYDCRTEFTN